MVSCVRSKVLRKFYSLQQSSIPKWAEQYAEQEYKRLCPWSRNILVSAIDSSHLDLEEFKALFVFVTADIATLLSGRRAGILVLARFPTT